MHNAEIWNGWTGSQTPGEFIAAQRERLGRYVSAADAVIDYVTEWNDNHEEQISEIDAKAMIAYLAAWMREENEDQ